MHDLRMAVRNIRRSPLVAAGSTAMLAVGVAATAVLFAVVDAVHFRPLPYPEAGRLVTLFGTFAAEGVDGRHSLSWQEIREIAARTRTLEAVAAFAGWRTLNLGPGSGHAAERLYANAVSGAYFDLLGGRPLRGRTFTAGEANETGREAVVIVSERVWRERLGARADVIGHDVHLSDRAYRIVGVMPADFRDINVEIPPDVWLPIGLAPVVYGPDALVSWTGRMFNGVALIKRGVSHDDVQGDLDRIAAMLARERPASNREAGFNAETIGAHFYRRVRQPAAVLAGAAVLVLVLASANMLLLLLMSGRVRAADRAVRAALGARIHRLVLPGVFEVLLLVAGAGAAGVILARWLLELVRASGQLPLPSFAALAIDRRVLAATLCVTAIATAAAAIVPALRAARTRATDLLHSGRGWVPPSDRTFELLLVIEVAFAVVLCSGAFGLATEFTRLRDGQMPFPIDDFMTARVDLRGPRYDPPDARRRFADDLLQRLGSGTAASTSALWGPSIPGRAHFYVEIARSPQPSEAEVLRPWRHHVSPGALRLVGIPIVRGRDFEVSDDERVPRVAILNAAAAALLWPGTDALGQRFWIRGVPDPVTVIGLAANTRPTGDMSASMPHALYVSFAQIPERSLVLIGRPPAPESYAQSLRGAVAGLDAGLPVHDVATLRSRVDEENGPMRFGASIMSVYAVTAAGLACAGIHAVLAFGIAARRREIALRIVLGASPARLRRMLMLQGMRAVGAGAALGGASALALGRAAVTLDISFPASPAACIGAAAALTMLGGLSAARLVRRAAVVAPVAELGR